MSKTKEVSQVNHARIRANQRYGINLSEHDYNAMCSIIDKGDSIIVNKQSNRITIHQLNWNDQKIHVAYDKIRQTIVTFLPLC